MDMQSSIDDVRKEMGVCMQYDVLFDHLTTKEHLLLYAQIKAPHLTKQEVNEQVHRQVATFVSQYYFVQLHFLREISFFFRGAICYLD